MPYTQGHLAAPTQVKSPWRATVRSGFQTLLALLTILPFVLAELPDGVAAPVVAGIVLVSSTVTRIMALPQVNAFLEAYVKWLAPAKPDAEQVIASTEE